MIRSNSVFGGRAQYVCLEDISAMEELSDGGTLIILVSGNVIESKHSIQNWAASLGLEQPKVGETK